jgi:hypothetical protein
MTDTTHEAPERMKTIRLTVDLTYDQEVMHGDEDEAISWFNSILAGKDLMLGDFGELGDMIGSVQVVSRSDDLVQAAVAAALRDAAEQAEEWGAIVDHPNVYMGGPSRNAQRIAKGFAEEILALITPDAQAALDRVVAEQREKDAKVAFDAGCGWQALRTAALSSSWPEDAAKHLASEHAAFAIAVATRKGGE